MNGLGSMMGPGGPAPIGGPGPGPGPGAPAPAASITLGGNDPDSGGEGAGNAPGGDGDAEQDLHDALDALHSFLQDDQDHVDKSQIAKCVAIVQGILGSRQKGAESALGITPAHKAMSRSYGG